MSAVASPGRAWQRRPDATPLLSWRKKDLSSVAAVVASALRTWAGEWDLAVSTPGPVACRPSSEAGPDTAGEWRHVGGAAGASAWLRWEADQQLQMARCWFGAEAADSPVVALVVQACRQAAVDWLAASLRLTAGASVVAPDDSCCSPWSGAVLARAPGVGLLLVEAGVVRAIRSDAPRPPGLGAPPLVAMREAIRDLEMHVEVQLDGCELDVGQLQALQLGDVLTLRHRIEAPARVVQPGGCEWLPGWLAKARGRRAVELATPVTSP